MKQTVVITGGTDGIGQQTALQLADEETQIILIGRTKQKADAAINTIKSQAPDTDIQFWQADLSLMRDTLRIANRINEELTQLNTLIHCAGVMLPQRTLTDEGIETVFAVQYLSRWLLTKDVMPLLQKSTTPCVISVSAGGAFPLRLDWNNLMGEKFYHGAVALIHESIANDMQMMDYQQQYPSIQFYCYGPFWVPGTKLMSQMPSWFQWIGDVSGRLIGYTSKEAGEDVATLSQTQPIGDLFGRKLTPKKPTRWKANHENLRRLRQLSADLVQQALT